jgi:uncharacterized protein
MSMHGDWKTAKSKAKGMNNNREVKFAGSLNLGSALDTLESKYKARDMVRGDGGAPENNAITELKAAKKQVALICNAYLGQIKTMATAAPNQPIPPLTTTAKQHLDSHITFQILNKMNMMT